VSQSERNEPAANRVYFRIVLGQFVEVVRLAGREESERFCQAVEEGHTLGRGEVGGGSSSRSTSRPMVRPDSKARSVRVGLQGQRSIPTPKGESTAGGVWIARADARELTDLVRSSTAHAPGDLLCDRTDHAEAATLTVIFGPAAAGTFLARRLRPEKLADFVRRPALHYQRRGSAGAGRFVPWREQRTRADDGGRVR
jgi:hypothetical protein